MVSEMTRLIEKDQQGDSTYLITFCALSFCIDCTASSDDCSTCNQSFGFLCSLLHVAAKKNGPWCEAVSDPQQDIPNCNGSGLPQNPRTHHPCDHFVIILSSFFPSVYSLFHHSRIFSPSSSWNSLMLHACLATGAWLLDLSASTTVCEMKVYPLVVPR